MTQETYERMVRNQFQQLIEKDLPVALEDLLYKAHILVEEIAEEFLNLDLQEVKNICLT